MPEGHLFVLGDNRNNSEDSRYEGVGMIPIKDIRGRVRLRVWPLSHIQWVQNPFE